MMKLTATGPSSAPFPPLAVATSKNTGPRDRPRIRVAELASIAQSLDRHDVGHDRSLARRRHRDQIVRMLLPRIAVPGAESLDDLQARIDDPLLPVGDTYAPAERKTGD